MPATIPAPEALRLLLEKPGLTRAVDVRSEGECAEAAVPGFACLPIITNPERHEVGLCYKQKGQEAAIELGHGLTAPHQAARTEAWKQALAGAEFPLLTCFRGGLRSQLACGWLEKAGGRALRVEGGYKAMRQELLRAIEGAPEMLVVAGPTGSGKTRLLLEAGAPHLDLEGLANHKGSAFGGSLLAPQPAQATFENLVGLALLRGKPALVEDESVMIGQLVVPEALRARIAGGRVIRITMSAGERARLLFREYVTEPLAQGVPAEKILEHYLRSLGRIEKKLGGEAAAAIHGKLQIAFRSGGEAAHLEWIHALLELYYDKAYEYSFQKLPRETAFEGDWNACKEWISQQWTQNRFA